MEALLINDSYYLLSPQDILQKGSQLQLPQSDLEALNKILEWTHSFVCKPNFTQGREGGGPVCPYTKPSLRKKLFWLTVYQKKEVVLDEAFNTVMAYKARFLDLEPREDNEAVYKTILILFPQVAQTDAPNVIEKLQKMLKPEFVSCGLMIGQFYELCAEHGLWNPDFRPLSSPIPMLIIRSMTPLDFPFLKSKPEFIISYLKRFADNIPPHIKEDIANIICNAA